MHVFIALQWHAWLLKHCRVAVDGYMLLSACLQIKLTAVVNMPCKRGDENI
jgi:hypothetical protein